ncbi:Hypothetical predicted protein [Scomber scombrus]|uniref:Uncharacterized protein n=1 Tax=Scomber scombrus TaxID=13677 RepID=A0AAV1Q7G4_SCOSC
MQLTGSARWSAASEPFLSALHGTSSDNCELATGDDFEAADLIMNELCVDIELKFSDFHFKIYCFTFSVEKKPERAIVLTYDSEGFQDHNIVGGLWLAESEASVYPVDRVFCKQRVMDIKATMFLTSVRAPKIFNQD